jgi:endonuclease/exonuclease/phosphatase family metal-dependent hydrolase
MRLVKTGPLPTLPRLTGLERRGAVWVEVTAGDGRPVQIINTHLGLVPQEQQSQVRCLLGEDWLSHPACGGPVVVLGDFNATPRYAAYRALTGRLMDARRLAGVRQGALTFPSRLPLIRIDHIFVSRGLEARSVHAAASPLSRIASDHLPLVADVTLQPQQTG